MERIKIISDPYHKSTVFEKWQDESETWHRISLETDGNNPLLSEELTHGVFPFVVKKIVDAIIAVYRDAQGKTEIVFEGTDDEFRELELVCSSEEYADSIVLYKSGKYLDNARDILPDIMDVFNELTPLISESVRDKEKVRDELEKFSDASKDIIPICILGNYSSGKSTFINALIGSEVLPSSDAPLTAKIYKIKTSPHADRARIEFEHDDASVRIRIDEDQYKLISGSRNDPLVQKICAVMDGLKDESIARRVYAALEIINAAEDNISDLIEITIPFVGGEWGKSANDFVIFDTPGSNSASNEKHFQVLKKAMENLSNGLPVFVSEYNSLDSTDNDRLYQVIHGMEELDSRFTMIIVNKADTASLPKGGFTKEGEDRILGEAVPRHLYSEGIFFVSSVLGLGSKTQGEFTDDHYAEIYEDQKSKYSDPSSRFYKKLYLYNIMPEQLKQQAVETAEQCSDLVFANSGLFSVETEIQTFANKYSSYNKCQQSQLFLGRLIVITGEEIAAAKAQREESRRLRNEALERDQQILIEKLELTGHTKESVITEEYPEHMEEFVQKAEDANHQDSLEDEKEELMYAERAAQGYNELMDELQDSTGAVKEGLVSDLRAFVKTPGLSAIRAMGSNLYGNARNALANTGAVVTVNKQISEAVAEQLVKMLNEDIERITAETSESIDTESKAYLEAKKQEIKQALIEVVTGSDVLSDEKKKELSDIIIQFENMDLQVKEAAFAKEDYEKVIRLGKAIIGFTDQINLEKLKRDYNNRLHELVHKIYANIRTSHISSFREWVQSLLEVITDNIIDYSPALRNQKELINEETARILDLESKQRKLADYTEQIQQMMAWKEV